MGILEGFIPVAVTLLAFALYLAPGLLLLLLLPRPPERASTWLALSAPVAVAIQMVTESVLKIFAEPVRERVLATATVAIGILIAVLVRRRRFPVKGWADGRVILLAAAVPVVFGIAFEFWWRRDWTADGIEAIGMAEELATHFLPRWPSESGLKGFGQGLIAFAFPSAWLGSNPRAAFVLFLGVIVAQVMALAEARRQDRLGWVPAVAIAVSVLAAGLTLGLQVSFEPYFADPGNPAGPELMVVAMMLGAFLAVVERNPTVFLIAAVLAHATLPSGLLFVVVLGAAWFLMTRSRRVLVWTAGAIGLCILVTLLYEKVYVPHALPPGVAMDAGSETLLGRMRLLIFTDFARFAFLVIPCGFIPAVFLFFWKKQDAIACVATLVTAAMFLFFFVLATYSPHYFAPAMVLVLVPFWRWARGRAAWVGIAGAVAGLALSIPWSPAVRDPYCATADRISIEHELKGVRPRMAEFLVPASLLQQLAYLPWEDTDPRRQLVATGLQLAHHADLDRPARHDPKDTDWIVQPESSPIWDGYRPVASQSGWILLAREGAQIESIREHGFPTDFQNPWYRVPREALFRGWTERSGRYDVDLRALLGRAK